MVLENGIFESGDFFELNRDRIEAETIVDWWFNVMAHTDDEEFDLEGSELKDMVKDEV